MAIVREVVRLEGVLVSNLGHTDLRSHPFKSETQVAALFPAVQSSSPQLSLNTPLEVEVAFSQVVAGLFGSLVPEEIFRFLVQALGETLSLKGCAVGLWHQELSQFVIDYEWGKPFPGRSRRKNLAQLSAVHQQWRDTNAPEPTTLTLTGQPLDRLLAYPLSYDYQLIGGLFLVYPGDHPLQPRQIELLQYVAQHCDTALHQAYRYQAVQAQVLELEQLNQLKDDFLSTISHELRTPMANMKMAIQMLTLLLQDKGGTEPSAPNPATTQKVLRYLQILQNECDREALLINDLLDLQQLETNTLALVESAILLQEWLPYLVQPLHKRFQDRQQDFQLVIAADLPPLICDQLNLSRVLLELLNNAYKYTPSGEHISLTATQERSIKTPQSHVIQIRVCNTGVELPQEQWERIFDKFYRIPQLDPWKQGGTGLGLALARKLVTRQGGHIWASSANQQMCVFVELPLQA